jgi:hypothetical protein
MQYCLSALQLHPDSYRTTWRAQRQAAASGAWEDAVVKMYLEPWAWQHRNEVECYRALSGMAGVAELLAEEVLPSEAPRIEAYSDDDDDDDDAPPEDEEEEEEAPRVGLVVRWAGPVYDAVPPSALRRARRILEEMHRRGVAHGGVATRHMGYDAATGEVVLFDLAEGVTRASLGPRGGAAFRAACEGDMRDLEEEEAWAAANPDRWAIYVTGTGLVRPAG